MTDPTPPPADAARSAHRDHAARYGFFWTPCMRCGKWFGGHESVGSVMVDERKGVLTCCPDPPDGIEPPGVAERLRRWVEGCQ